MDRHPSVWLVATIALLAVFPALASAIGLSIDGTVRIVENQPGLPSPFARLAGSLQSSPWPEAQRYMIVDRPVHGDAPLPVSCSNRIAVYSRDTGQLLWQRFLDDAVVKAVARPDTLFVLTRKSLYAFGLEDGMPHWQYRLSTDALNSRILLSPSESSFANPINSPDPRGFTLPLMAVSQNGGRIAVCSDFSHIDLLSAEGNTRRVIRTAIADRNQFIAYNLLLFSGSNIVLKHGATVTEFSEAGREVYSFRMESNVLTAYPLVVHSPTEGTMLLLSGQSTLYLIDSRGKLRGAYRHPDTIAADSADGEHVYAIQGRGNLWCFDLRLKRIWQFRNPTKLKTGIPFFDILGLRVFFTCAPVAVSAGGKHYVFVVSENMAYLVTMDGALAAELPLGVANPNGTQSSGAREKMMKILVMANCTPVVSGNVIHLIISKVNGNVKQGSRDFSIEDRSVALRVE